MTASPQTPGIVAGRLASSVVEENFAEVAPRLTPHEALVAALERLDAGHFRAVQALADDVLAAARKYLNPGQMQVVLMGRPVEL